MNYKLNSREALAILNEDENSTTAKVITRLGDYLLYQDLVPAKSNNSYSYYLYYIKDDSGNSVGSPWLSKENANELVGTEEFINCQPVKDFFKYITETETLYIPDDDDIIDVTDDTRLVDKYGQVLDYDDDDIYNYFPDYIDKSTHNDNIRYTHYTPVKPVKSTGFLDKLNKSDTLVIHCEDRTTDMLSQIYEGKNWDVLRDGNIDKDELHKLIESHKNIVCLGHGTQFGLLNKQGYGYVIGDEEGPMLAKKNTFVIWCYASTFGKRHGCHGVWTGNLPSEVQELKWVNINDKEYTAEYVLENITYWSKLMADVVDRALAGDWHGAVKYVRENYLAKYDDEMTRYNAEHTEVI